MAHRNPKQRGNKFWPVYKQNWQDIKNPKLRSMTILEWVYGDSLLQVTSKDVSEQFGIPLAEAASRLLRLYKWGYLYIKTFSRGGKGKVKIYALNDNGENKCKDMLKKKGEDSKES